MAGMLESLARNETDELLIAHNSSGARPAEVGPVQIIPARELRAAGYARNCAARVARGEWLVFIDADTSPRPDLLDAYFDPPPRDETAVLAGAIVDVPGGSGLAARHSVARSQMSQQVTLDRAGTPYAQTANCAVRGDAFAAVGGFEDGIVAGEDADLCFRLCRAGWELEQRPDALVEHRTRPTMTALLHQLTAHGAAAAWADRRYPGEFPALGARRLAALVARKSLDVLHRAVRGEGQAAAFAALDALTVAAFELGRRRSNLAVGIATPEQAAKQRGAKDQRA